MNESLSRREFVQKAGLGAALSFSALPFAAYAGRRMAQPDMQMQAVLNEFASFHAPPLETLSPENARNLPTATDAVVSLLSKRGKPAMQMVGGIQHKLITGAEGDLLARFYMPKGSGPFPVTVYFHGGGWVIANLDTYDSSCRALCNLTNSIIVSVAYRQAPEHKFPAAAEDAYAATNWVMRNAASFGGDPKRVAVAGESAGGNLAAVTCLMARDKNSQSPVHQLLVYPVTNYAFDTPSYQENADAKPLNAPMMRWFWEKYLNNPNDGNNPYASPLRADNLKGLPPATVITAQIDPLYSEGEMYAQKLKDAGIAVMQTRYNGVTHEFFGMGAVLDKAKAAEKEAATGLKMAFMKA